VDVWNNHDRERFIACFTEDCEFNLPTLWDLNATAFGAGHVRVKMAIESGETVVLEAVGVARPHGHPLQRSSW
jgi:hypothetical protein